MYKFKIKKNYFINLLFLIIAIAIGSQILGFDRDHSNYLYFFENDLIRTNFSDFRYAFGYTSLVYTLQLTPIPTSAYFIFFALLSILPKFFLLNKLSQGKLLPYIYYFSPFLVIQDDTQIRLAVSLAFSAWGIYYLIKKNYKLSFLLITTAQLFHFQTTIIIMMIPLALFITKPNIKTKAILWLSAIYIFSFIALNLYSFQILSLISGVYTELNNYISTEDHGNPLNPFIILNIALLLWSLKILKNEERLFKFFWIIGLFGVLLYYLLLPFGSFIHRISEQLLFFNCFWIGHALKNKCYFFSRSLGYIIVLALFATTIYISYYKENSLYFQTPLDIFQEN